MSSATQGRLQVRCSCGKKYLFRRELAGHKGSCPACNATFLIPIESGDAIAPAATGANAGPGQVPIEPLLSPARFKQPWWKNYRWYNLAIVWAVAVGLSAIYQAQLSGEEFTNFYILMALVCGAACTYVNTSGCPTAAGCAVSILAFESIGVTRIVDAWMRGMRDFDHMLWTMVIAPIVILYLIRTNFGLKSKSYGSSSCSGCQGCGGGGGCGGCGGD